MFRGGNRVRVRNPEGGGTVSALIIAIEPQREYAWVRYLEGPEAGANARVPCRELKLA